jgi:hypothetical protein
MRHNLKLSLFILILVLTILACGGSADVPTAGEKGILFQDDFSDPTSGWDRVRREGEGITDYEEGAYRIKVETINTDVWANPEGQSFSNVRIEVQATKSPGGTDNNDFGVICRYKNEANFYFFIISSDGYYGIGKVKEGDQQLIDMEDMYPTDKINLGDAVNQIRADCIGSTLTLFINGTEIDKKVDDEIKGENVGLIAGTFDTAYTDILFDNFKVTQP